MAIKELNCKTCNIKFITKRALHKGRNPSFCNPKCIKINFEKDDPRFKWRLGKGFWQTASEEEKFEKLKQEFERLVIKKDGCWEWKNKLLPNGYAKIHYGKGKFITAHRAAWLIHKGPIQDGLMVLHTCDSRYCSNISHLSLGSHNDNMQDMVNKNRQMKELKHYCAKLNIEQVLKIRTLLENGYKVFDLAKMFNVNSGTISDIKYRKTWKDI